MSILFKYSRLYTCVAFAIVATVSNVTYAASGHSTSFSANRKTLPTSYDKRCYPDIPAANHNKISKDQMDSVEVTAAADNVDATMNQTVEYSGNVEIVQGNKVLKADRSIYNQSTQEMEAIGNVYYTDGEITAESDTSIKTNLTTHDTELDAPSYHINGTLVRGTADRAVLDQTNKKFTLEGARVTTCPKNQESWSMSASSIEVEQEEIFGEAWNSVLRISDIPVFYVPYINFPVKNQRKSGLLYPNINYFRSDGFVYELPIYWNIAPNYDLTYTPKVFQHRGLMHRAQFRYLPFANTYGSIYGEYLRKDKEVEREWNHKHADDEELMDKRWLFNIKQATKWDNSDYGILIDYTKVREGDLNYINDLDPPRIKQVDSQLMQQVMMYVDKNAFDASVTFLKYQLMLPEFAVAYQPFELWPRVSANYRDTLEDILAYNFSFEFSNFRVKDYVGSGRYQGNRYHFQTDIEVPIIKTKGVVLTSTTRGFYTHYEQDIPQKFNNTYLSYGYTDGMLASSTNRWTYDTELYGKLVFENKLDNGYALTIEPELQYTYMPYRDQTDIGIYDTTDREYDYYTLFSYKTFAGLDRLADMNRIAYGFSHHVYDENYREMLRFSIGQSYNFHETRTTLYPKDKFTTYPRSPITAAINANLFEYFTTHADVVYNTENGETTSWNAMLRAQYEDYSAQVSYRYTRDGNKTLKNEIIDLKQFGSSLAFPITDNFKVIGTMFYDLQQSKNIDEKLAFKYESCCYSIGFYAEKYNKPDNRTLTADTEDKFGIMFELKGLMGVGMDSYFNADTKLLPQPNNINLNQ